MKAFYFKLCSLVESFLGLGYRRCLVCHKTIWKENLVFNLCEDCWKRLNRVLKTDFYCPKCGELYQGGKKEFVCYKCRKSPPIWDRLGFLGIYQGLLKEIIISYKFKKRLYLSVLLGNFLVFAYKENFSRYKPDIIVPVPVFNDSLRIRGFNHVLEMSKQLSKYLDVRLEFKALKKIKPTRAQVELDYKKRWINLKGAFEADPLRVRDKSVLLIDDVFTTGATAVMCSRALKRAGAKHINVLVVARSV